MSIMRNVFNAQILVVRAQFGTNNIDAYTDSELYTQVIFLGTVWPKPGLVASCPNQTHIYGLLSAALAETISSCSLRRNARYIHPCTSSSSPPTLAPTHTLLLTPATTRLLIHTLHPTTHVSRLILRPNLAYSTTFSCPISSLIPPSFSCTAETSSSIFSVDEASNCCTSGRGSEKNESPIL